MSGLFKGLEPVRVSPIIKGMRWILLSVGIVYGFNKHMFLSNREVGIREEEEKMKQVRESAIKAEKAEQSRKEMQMLSELFLGPEAQIEEPSEPIPEPLEPIPEPSEPIPEPLEPIPEASEPIPESDVAAE